MSGSRKTFRIFLWITALAGLAMATFAFVSSTTKSQPSYVTNLASEGKLRDIVTATGSVNAVVTVEVGSQQSGQIDRLLVDFNDAVTKGQAVAQLDQQSYEARQAEAHASLEMAKAMVAIKTAELDRAKADLEEIQSNLAILTARLGGAKAKLEAADANLQRVGGLVEKGVTAAGNLDSIIAEQKVNAAAVAEAEALVAAHDIKVASAAANVARQQADLSNARASIPQKQALLNLAEVELKRTVIRSPIDGIVIKRNVSEGQTVAASLEAPTLFTIAQDLKEMELHASVDETDIGRIRVGQSAQFTVDAFPGRVFAGIVTQIRKAHEVIQNVVTYTVVIKTRNDELLLLPGMTAVIQILVMESEIVIRIPTAALSFRPSGFDLEGVKTTASAEGETVVWVLRADSMPRPVKIVTGPSDRSSTAIVSGEIKAGDQVITAEIAAPPQRRFLGIRIGF